MEELKNFVFDAPGHFESISNVPLALDESTVKGSTLDSAYFSVFDIKKFVKLGTDAGMDITKVSRNVNRISGIFVAEFDVNTGRFPVFLNNMHFLTNTFESVSYLHKTNRKEITSVDLRVANDKDTFKLHLIESENLGKKPVVLDLAADGGESFSILDASGNVLYSRMYRDYFSVILSPYDMNVFMIYVSKTEKFVFRTSEDIIRDVIANKFVKRKSPVERDNLHYVSCPSQKNRLFIRSNTISRPGVFPRSSFHFDGDEDEDDPEVLKYDVLLLNSLQKIHDKTVHVDLYDDHFSITGKGIDSVKRKYSIFSQVLSAENSLVAKLIVDEYMYVYLGFRTYEAKTGFIRHFNTKRNAVVFPRPPRPDTYKCATKYQGSEMEISVSLEPNRFTVENDATGEVFTSDYSVYNTIKIAPAKTASMKRKSCHLYLKDNMYLKMAFSSEDDLTRFVGNFREKRDRVLAQVMPRGEASIIEKKVLKCHVVDTGKYLGLCTVRAMLGHVDIFRGKELVKAYSLDFSKIYLSPTNPKQLKLQFLGGRYLHLHFAIVYDLKYFVRDYQRATFEILGSKKKTEKKDNVEISTYLDGVVNGEVIEPRHKQGVVVHKFEAEIVDEKGNTLSEAEIELGFESLSLLVKKDNSRFRNSLNNIAFRRSKRRDVANIHIDKGREYTLSMPRYIMNRIKYLLDSYKANEVFFIKNQYTVRDAQVMNEIDRYNRVLQKGSEYDLEVVFTVDILDRFWKMEKPGVKMIIQKKKDEDKVTIELADEHKFEIGPDFVIKIHRALPAIAVGNDSKIEHLYQFLTNKEKVEFIKTIRPYLPKKKEVTEEVESDEEPDEKDEDKDEEDGTEMKSKSSESSSESGSSSTPSSSD